MKAENKIAEPQSPAEKKPKPRINSINTDMNPYPPELSERICEERSEPVPMFLRSDGTYECLASSACDRLCRDKTLDPHPGY